MLATGGCHDYYYEILLLADMAGVNSRFASVTDDEIAVVVSDKDSVNTREQPKCL